MRRKRLNHYADVVCKMFVGWRMGDDLEILSELPDGKITINLLNAQANHSIAGHLDLHISKEIQAWLVHESQKEGIDLNQVESGTLEVSIDTGKVATNKKKVVMFNYECLSTIKTDETSYHGQLKDVSHWHTRTTT